MEEGNQFSGKNAENIENNTNLESGDFIFYNLNKEEAKKNLDISAKEWTDYIEAITEDVPDLTEEEINAGVEKILARAYPDNVNAEPSQTNKKKKVTLRVLFIAALISILSVSGLFVVGSSHNISIENGFVSFANDTIQIVFFGEKDEEFITVDALLSDLEMNGYDDILFPQEFVTNSDEYKVSVPEYSEDVLRQVVFDIYSENATYTFGIYDYDQNQKSRDFDNIKTAESIYINDTYIYMFEFDGGASAIEFTYGKYHFYMHSLSASYSEVAEIAKTLK